MNQQERNRLISEGLRMAWKRRKEAKTTDKAGKLPDITEAEFTRQVIELARLHRWIVAHFRGVRVQRANGQSYYETPVQGDGRGFPDLILLKTGKTGIAAELKVGKKQPTANQWYWLTSFAAAGFYAEVWRPEDWPKIEVLLAGRPAAG